MSKAKRSKKAEYLYARAPGRFDDHVQSVCDEIPLRFPEVRTMTNLVRVLAMCKRDLIYISEAADTRDEVQYCMDLILEFHFGIRRVPSMLDSPMKITGHLHRRVADLVKCYAGEHGGKAVAENDESDSPTTASS